MSCGATDANRYPQSYSLGNVSVVSKLITVEIGKFVEVVHESWIESPMALVIKCATILTGSVPEGIKYGLKNSSRIHVKFTYDYLGQEKFVPVDLVISQLALRSALF
jgi:hypothetical protein